MSSDGAPRAKEIVAMPASIGKRPGAQVLRRDAVAMRVNAFRRLLGALVLATALLVPAAAQAAPTGVNVSHLDDDGDPYVKAAGNIGAGDTAQTWSDLEQSGAKLVRSFVSWDTLTGGARDLQISKYRGFADKANARGMRVLLTVTGAPLPHPDPARYAAAVADLASQLKGRNVAYEIWNEPDETTFWHNGPQPAEYAVLLKAAYPAIKGADLSAVVLVGGLTGNNFEFVEHLYDNGAQGSFDGVGVHTDTACLTTDPREYYREPSGRIGRYSFTGYREVRRTMLDHGDDKPVWMTELGWASRPTSSPRPTAASPTTRGSSRPPGSTCTTSRRARPTTRSTSGSSPTASSASPP